MGYVQLFLVLLLLLYILWLMRQILAWKMYPATTLAKDEKDLPFVTVVVPARNEAHRMDEVLACIMAQAYPFDRLQIIVSDDHSEDETVHVASALLAHSKFSWRIIKADANDFPGKKHALWRAINVASGDIILTTDADCVMGHDWVKSMAIKCQAPNVHMVTGMVLLHDAQPLVAKLEQLDQLALSAMGATSVISQSPLLCSGANLAFKKRAFQDVGGYAQGIHDPSGDDTYLMLQMGDAVVFNKDRNAVVHTHPQSTLKSIFSQRKRWASKVPGYKNLRIALTGVCLAALNLAPMVLLALTITGSVSVSWLLGWWLIKCFFDILYLAPVASYYHQTRVLWVAPIYALLYPVYALVAMFTVFDRGYVWKGRQYGT